MSEQPKIVPATGSSRREFLKTSSVAVVGGTLAAQLGYSRQAHAALNDDTIKIALIGCGGRGSGAAAQALSTKGNVKLIAMADAFQYRIDSAIKNITNETKKGAQKSKDGEAAPDVNAKVDVPPERQFTGFDAYQKAIDSGADLVILATPPGFRPIHYEAAVKAGKNIFMEKPVATDAPGIRKVLEATEEAKKKNLVVGVGLQRRHQAGYLETLKRFQDGQIGDFIAARVYWNGTRPWKNTREKVRKDILKKDEISEMEYQMVNWYYFSWLCGDHIVEQHIHNIDVGNWFKGEHPVKAYGMGGSQIPRDKDDGDIFDHHTVEFEYGDGSRMFSQCRHQRGAWATVAEHIHGTKGTCSLNGEAKTWTMTPNGGEIWRYRATNPTPYQVEHDDLFAAIREGKPYNEAETGAHSTMTAIMGRMATYGGKEVKWDDAINSQISIMPSEYSFTAKTPIAPGENGMYAQAVPGLSKVV